MVDCAAAYESRGADRAGSGSGLALKAETKMENREARKRIAERYVASARLVLLWERVWLAMWPGIGIVGIGMMLALLGVFTYVPGYIHAILLLIFFGSVGYYFWSTFSTV